MCYEKLAGATLLIFANKQDLAGALSFEDIAEILDLETLAEHRHVQIVVTNFCLWKSYLINPQKRLFCTATCKSYKNFLLSANIDQCLMCGQNL